MIKRFLNWLLEFLRKKDPEFEGPFPDFSVDDLAEKLKILEEAEQLGKKNKPSDSDGLLSVGTEEKIKQEIVSRLTKCHEHVQKAVNTLEGEMKSINFEQHFQQLNYQYEQTEADLESAFARGITDITERRKEVVGIKNDYENFKQVNKLDHYPDYPDSQWLGWATLIAMVILESLFNSYFFAEGSELGLLGGAIQAFIISVINVGIAYIFANFVFRLVFHRSKSKRTLGIVGFIVYLIGIVIFVYAITHYRDAFTIDPDNAWPIAQSKIASLDFGFLDINSYIFLALSGAIAFIAFIKSFKMDDPYPKYGRFHRRLLDTENSLRSESDNLIEEITEIKEKSDDVIHNIRTDVQDLYDSLNLNNSNTYNLVDLYKKYHHKLITTGDSLVAQFRDQNTLHRSDSAPSSFSKKVTFDNEKFDLSKRELINFKNIESNWLSFDKKIESTLLKSEKMLKEYINKFEIEDGQP